MACAATKTSLDFVCVSDGAWGWYRSSSYIAGESCIKDRLLRRLLSPSYLLLL